MEHRPVLLNECIQALRIKPDGLYLDGTLGGGGHSLEIVRRLDGGRLIAIDRDLSAIKAARERFAEYSGAIILEHANFSDLATVLDRHNIEKVDGMLFDCGVSSPQLDRAERGFSYMRDGELDMRMDTSQSLTAYEIVNTWPEDKLRRILREFGEERYAPLIAKGIVSRRGQCELRTTAELAETIRSAMPASALRERQHPAKRSFQAFRIAVNGELDSIAAMLEQAADRLNTGGRLAVISFHSLEDRIVKRAMAARERGCTCPREFPVCVCGFKPTLRQLTRKPIVPGSEEAEANPRARSAKLRVAERVD